MRICEIIEEKSDNVSNFISTAKEEIAKKYGDVRISFQQRGNNRVIFQDPMQGVRTKRDWNIIKDVTQLARQFGITMTVHGAGGRSPWK